MMVMREAACGCGQLRVACDGDPTLVSMCHCLDCQRRTGSIFGVQAWFPRDKVSAPIGAAQHYTRRGTSGRAVTFRFCPICGSTVFWEADKLPGLVAIGVGAFADPLFPKPSHSVWESRQHGWTAAICDEVAEHAES